jgi:hypothetical protein
VDEDLTCIECKYFEVYNVGPYGMAGKCGALILYADQIKTRGIDGKLGALVFKFFARFTYNRLIKNCKYPELVTGATI